MREQINNFKDQLVLDFLRQRNRLSSPDLWEHKDSLYIHVQGAFTTIVILYLLIEIVLHTFTDFKSIDWFITLILYPAIVRMTLNKLGKHKLAKLLSPHLLLITLNLTAVINAIEYGMYDVGSGASFTWMIWTLSLTLAAFILPAKQMPFHAIIIFFLSLLSYPGEQFKITHYLIVVLFLVAVVSVIFPIAYAVEKLVRRNNNRTQRLQEEYQSDKELLYELAHNLKTPLTIVLLETSKLLPKSRSKQARQMHRLIEEVRESTDKLMDLANLNVNMLTSAVKTDTIGHFISEVTSDARLLCEHFERVFGSKRILKVKVEKSIRHIKISLLLEQIRIAILNLLDNAIMHGAPSSDVTIEINVNRRGPNWLIQIRDDGVGMSEERIRDILSPNSKNSLRKTSGINISKNIVEANEGTLSIISEPNKGTTAKITLPFIIRG